MQTADEFIEHLALEQHIEGGYYRSSYRSDMPFDDNRALWSSIYFLLRTGKCRIFIASRLTRCGISMRGNH